MSEIKLISIEKVLKLSLSEIEILENRVWAYWQKLDKIVKFRKLEEQI